ncbi:hypothetical protein AWRIB429_0772 [Oenococcus oeni AWRIB429]|uniref:Uncharacterized protein n=1 Tax=Oenococcus oeni AWRIB429 TaxID=655225 RepID=D3L8U2_OENOE|nr:hypothetical protein AWRIB429_0772 [Oenococcus oeni AWRIB429]
MDFFIVFVFYSFSVLSINISTFLIYCFSMSNHKSNCGGTINFIHSFGFI